MNRRGSAVKAKSFSIAYATRKKRIIVGLVTMLLLLTAAIVWFYFFETSRVERVMLDELGVSIEPVTQEERDSYTVPPDDPRYLTIEAAGVHKARVLSIGVKAPNKDGVQQMDEPKTIDDVGWYNCQINPAESRKCATPKRPGDGNTAVADVIDGHTCFSNSLTCVFDNISRLQSGDKIMIERGDGSQLTYTVKKVEVLDLASGVDMAKAMKPIEADKEGLTLITCAGTYRGATDINGVLTASKRVLVYAIR